MIYLTTEEDSSVFFWKQLGGNSLLKAILFDMDGVLIDSENEYLSQQMRIGKELGVEFEEHVLKKYMGESTPDTWVGLKKDYDLKEDSQVLAQRELERMDEHYEKGELNPIEDSVELLKKCRDYGLKTAIATSTFKQNAHSVAKRLGLNPFVGAIATSCMAGASKPEPDIFLLAANMLSTPPDECLVIEDSHSGLIAAKRAGMAAVVLAPEGEKFDTSSADKVVKSCVELDLSTLEEIHIKSIRK